MFKALNIFDKFKEIGCSNATIHPVRMELMRTNKGKDRAQRQALLDLYEFEDIPLNHPDMQNYIDRIRVFLENQERYPSPTDLYLASTISKYSRSNTLLLTGNTNDFPLPLFKRESFLILQNKYTYKLLSFIRIEGDVLEKFGETITGTHRKDTLPTP